MKILQIASFTGNIGDLVNHHGFYESMGIDGNNIEKMEMREFYNNYSGEKRFFDATLAHKINEYDLLVLGGGGFFDVLWDNSSTGTTFDMSEEFVDLLKIPVVVNAMGVFTEQNKDKANEKFGRFLSIIAQKDNWFVSIRNDGSRKRIKQICKSVNLDKIITVPDNGFVETDVIDRKVIADTKVVGINLTDELKDLCYTDGTDINSFYEKMKRCILKLIQDGMTVCFLLHTPQDYEALYKMMELIGREWFRKNIVIAPYLPYDRGESLSEFIKYYRTCDVVVGMRFHSNVLSIANNIPVVGLAIHNQIEDLYEENNLLSHCIRVGSKDWDVLLYNQIMNILYSPKDYLDSQKRVHSIICQQHDEYISTLKSWIKEHVTR